MEKGVWTLTPGLERIRDWAEAEKIDLYIVGGWVRDSLLGMPAWDADLSGPLLPEQLEPRLPLDSSVTLTLRDAGLGTVELHALGETFEYTAFRKESYRPGGAHRPSRVTLGASLEEDAYRRDFKVNAMYLRLRDFVLMDPTGGRYDLEQRLLSSTRDPDEVLNEDGLRLLRLVRQAAELEFTPEEATWASAVRHAELLGDIAPERLRDELNRILTADLRHPEKTYAEPPAVTALKGLSALGAWKQLCPAAEGPASDPRRVRAACLIRPEPALRLAALWQPLTAPELEDACLSLRLTREETRRITLLAPLAGAALSDTEFRLLAAPLGLPDARDLTEVRACLAREGLSPASPREREILERMRKEGVPFSLAGLAVRGRDLLPVLGGASPRVGEVLRILWRHVILRPEDNEYDTLIRLAREKESECPEK